MNPHDSTFPRLGQQPPHFNELRFFADYPGLTREQLADFYGHSVSTFRRRVKNLNLNLAANPLYPPEVKQIFSILGYPPKCHHYYE